MTQLTQDPALPAAQKGAWLREARRLMSLAIPIIASLAAATLIGVVDTVMISPLGTEALAAASITTSAAIIFYASLYGLVSVTGVLAAHEFGARNVPGVGSTLRHGLVLALAGGGLATILMAAMLLLLPAIGQPPDVVEIAVPYWLCMALLMIPFALFFAIKGVFEAVERAWFAVAVSYLAVVVNVPANWILIHELRLGLMGAGLASLLSQSFSFGLAYVYWQMSKTTRQYRENPGPITVTGVRRQLHEGMPLAIGYAGEGGAFALAGLMLGWFGAIALAANQIVSAVTSVLYMLPLGMAAAVSIRIGQAIGEGQTYRLRRIGMTAVWLVGIWMLLTMIFLIVLRFPLADLLSDSEDVIVLAAAMFLAFAALQITDGVQATALGALRGMLDNRWPVVVTLTLYWGLSLPMAYVLSGPMGFGPNGIWIGYGTGLFVAAIALVWRFLRNTAPKASPEGSE